MPTVYQIQIAKALGKLALDVGIVPRDTLALPAAAGDASVTLTSGLAFLSEITFTLWDATGEPRWAIGHKDSAAPAVLPLDPSGRVDAAGTPVAGLLFSHAAGTLVATNLFRTPLSDTSRHFENGWPCFCAWVPDDLRRYPSTQEMQGAVTAAVLYQISGKQGSAAPMDPQVWVEQQLDRCETDMKRFTDAVQDNFRLVLDLGDGTGAVAHAEDMTEIRTRRRNFQQEMSGNPVFEFYTEITFRSLRRPQRGP